MLLGEKVVTTESKNLENDAETIKDADFPIVILVSPQDDGGRIFCFELAF